MIGSTQERMDLYRKLARDPRCQQYILIYQIQVSKNSSTAILRVNPRGKSSFTNFLDKSRCLHLVSSIDSLYNYLMDIILIFFLNQISKLMKEVA